MQIVFQNLSLNCRVQKTTKRSAANSSVDRRTSAALWDSVEGWLRLKIHRCSQNKMINYCERYVIYQCSRTITENKLVKAIKCFGKDVHI